MHAHAADLPPVMAFAGLDPTGGAGLHADIEAIASVGCHALPVITAVTAQDTTDVHSCTPVDAIEVIGQARTVLADVPVGAFKVGVVGSVANAEAIHTILHEHPGVPVVVDPVCRSGAGTPFADEDLIDALVTLLLPLATVVTPNTLEGRLLAPEADSPGAVAQQIMSYGARHVLLTGTHEPGVQVRNRFYGDRRELQTFEWERLAGEFHGSGCTLASALAGHLAHGVDALAAVAHAQRYTWETLRHAHRLGAGQLVPDRLYWSRQWHNPV